MGIEESKSQIANVRNPEDLENYPDLVDIKAAMTCAFDFIVELYKFKYKVTEVGELELGDEDRVILANTLGLEDNDDSLNDIFWFHQITKGRCDVASKVIHEFVKQYLSDKFDCWLLASGSPQLKYFDYHYVTVLKNKEIGIYYLVSPANIFNYYNDFADPKARHNFSSPTYNGQNFDRSVSVFIAYSYEAIIQSLQSIEGKGTTWKDQSSEEAKFRQMLVKINGRNCSISGFVKDWKNSEYEQDNPEEI